MTGIIVVTVEGSGFSCYFSTVLVEVSSKPFCPKFLVKLDDAAKGWPYSPRLLCILAVHAQDGPPATNLKEYWCLPPNLNLNPSRRLDPFTYPQLHGGWGDHVAHACFRNLSTGGKLFRGPCIEGMYCWAF